MISANLHGLQGLYNHQRFKWPDIASHLAPNLLERDIKFPDFEMEKILQEINELPGVRGSFLCDGNGVVISSAMPEIYHEEVGNIGKEVVQVLGLLQILGEETDVLEFLFSDGRILVNGLADFSLIVFCDPDIDISMLRLRTNVALAEIRRNGKFKKHMHKVFKSKKGLLAGEGLDESYQQIINRLKPQDR
ncbi:MAG: hypothetical protein GTN74_07205 [Proteobacteria bacterium]|nr:hypothetical protein [Pseudomonadota bacterium]